MRRPASGGVTLQSLTISPTLPSVAVGSQVQMTATGHYSDGSDLNLTSAVTWASSNHSVGTIASGAGQGVFNALAQGSTNVSASLGSVQSNVIAATVPAATATHVSFPFPQSLGATPEAGGRIYTFPIFIPPDVASLDVLMANRISDAIAQPDITVNVAVYQSDGTGAPTGSPFAVFNAQVVPGDNTLATIGPFPGIVRGPDGQVVVLVGMDQGETPVYIPGVEQGLYVSGTHDVSVIPGAWSGPNPNSVLDVHLSYNTGARRIVVIGDALSVGYSGTASVNYEQSQFILMASELVFAVDNAAVINSNSSISGWSNFAAHPTWYDGTIWTTSDVCINLGTNDLSYNNLLTMQNSLQTLIAHLQTLGVNRIYASTIPPQAAYPGTNTVRASYNAWLLANFVALGITAVRDRAAAQTDGGLADNTDPNALFAAYAQADGTNLTVAGYRADATGWEMIL